MILFLIFGEVYWRIEQESFHLLKLPEVADGIFLLCILIEQESFHLLKLSEGSGRNFSLVHTDRARVVSFFEALGGVGWKFFSCAY